MDDDSSDVTSSDDAALAKVLESARFKGTARHRRSAPERRLAADRAARNRHRSEALAQVVHNSDDDSVRGNSDSDWRQVKLEIAPSDVNGQPLTDSDGNAVGWERCSVQGGGCLSPQKVGDPVQSAVWLLFPLIGLGGLARRRDD